MAVVIQNWEFTGDFCVSGYQHRWQHYKMDRNAVVALLNIGIVVGLMAKYVMQHYLITKQ